VEECILWKLAPVSQHRLVHFPQQTDAQAELLIHQYSDTIIKAFSLVWFYDVCSSDMKLESKQNTEEVQPELWINTEIFS